MDAGSGTPHRSAPPRQTALVLGSGDVASAVAHALHSAGFAVALQEDALPAHHRRGMAFSDALWDGEATLDGVLARRCDSPAAVADALRSREGIAAFHGPLTALVGPRTWAVLVDARLRKRDAPQDLRASAPLVVGLGPGFTPGVNCHVAVETSWEDLGRVVWEGTTLPLRGEPKPIGGVGRERAVYAPASGTFRTDRRIGERVERKESVGRIAGHVLAAPLSGVLRGLARDGADVHQGAKVVEVDPRGDPALCFGPGERPRRIAAGVLRALGVAA